MALDLFSGGRSQEVFLKTPKNEDQDKQDCAQKNQDCAQGQSDTAEVGGYPANVFPPPLEFVVYLLKFVSRFCRQRSEVRFAAK